MNKLHTYTIPYSKTNKDGKPILTIDEFIAFVHSEDTLVELLNMFLNESTTQRYISEGIKVSNTEEFYQALLKDNGGEVTTEVSFHSFVSKTDTHMKVEAHQVMAQVSITEVMKEFWPKKNDVEWHEG